MSCCSRCQRVPRRHCLLCSERLWPVNVDFCRMSFDPDKAKTTCGVASQQSLKFLTRVSIALVAFLRLTTCTTCRDWHYTFSVRSDLEIPIMHLHRSDDSQQFCTIVRLLTPRQGEGAISVVVDTKVSSTACTSEPRILIADTCSISPGHDAVVAPDFPPESLIRKDAVLQGVARMCSCTRSHV